MGALSAILVLAGLLPLYTRAQASINTVFQEVLTDSDEVKYPDVDVANRTVAVAGTSNRDSANTWWKTIDQQSFGSPTQVGATSGQEDFVNTALSGRSDGTITYAWFANADDSPIKVRQRFSNNTFSDEVTAVGGGPFRAYVDVASNNAGTTIVAWSENKRFRYVYSTGGNLQQWNGGGAIINFDSLNRPILAVGPDDKIGVTFGTADGDIYYGEWNGSGFTTELVAGTDNFEADPTLTFLPNGTPVIAWRRVGPGYFYAERKGFGDWPTSRLSSDELVTVAAIAADESGNMAFAWSAIGSSPSPGLKVAFRTAGTNGEFVGPITVNRTEDFRANPMLAATITDRSQIHLVSERFGGSGLDTDYYQLVGSGLAPPSAVPSVSSSVTIGGLPVVRGNVGVRVDFRDVTGNVNQVRWRWGGIPNDAVNDSGNWVAYTSTMTIPVSSIVNTGDCLAETLFTQVRNADTIDTTVRQVSVIVDSSVGGSLRVTNPNLTSRYPLFTPIETAQLTPQDLNTEGGASDGDPGYTRVPFFYFEAIGTGECVGLSNFQYGASATSLGATIAVTNNLFANNLLLPNPTNTAESPRSIFMVLRDDLGNQIDFSTSIIYDRTKPVLANGATFTVTSDTNASILANLDFDNVQVTDVYPGGYWGLWVANSTTPVSDTLNSTALVWTPVKLNVRGSQPLLSNWSLLTGLSPNALAPNTTVYVYARFLDGAGNPSDQVLQQQITVANPTLPTIRLPLIRR